MHRSIVRTDPINSHVVTTNDIRPCSVGLYLLLAAVVLFFSFSQHPSCLFTGTDGNLFTILMATERLFRIPFSQLGASPLEGNFDAYLTLNRDYLVSEAIGRIFAGGTPSKPLTFAVCSMFLVICGYAMARAAGATRAISFSAGLLIPVVLMPIFQGEATLVDSPLYNINPYFSQGIGISLLFVCAFWQLSGRWDGTGLAWMLVPLACVVLTMASQPQTAVVMGPGIAIYGAASLLDARHWRQNIQRVVAGLLIILAAVLLGFFQYEIALVKYTAYYLFGYEFEQNRRDLTFASMIFQGRVGVLIVGFAYMGALYAILFEKSRLRILAGAFIVSTSVFLAVAYAVVAWASDYHGISPSYIETYLLPFHLLFAVVAIAGPVTRLGKFLPLREPFRGRLAQTCSHLLAAMVLIAVASWNLTNAHAEDPRHCRLGGLPIRATPITDRLVADIASAPGQQFRGLVATFNGYIGQDATDLFRLKDNDSNLWVAIGNDHRDVGLWHFQIPTLLQYSPFITAPYYLMLTEFLSRSTDKQVRNWVVLTRTNEAMLKLWGVRYLITDFDPAIGSLVLEMGVPRADELPADMAQYFAKVVRPSYIQRLTELADPNLGNYSPTEIRRASDFASGLAIMREPGFDGRTTVVTDADLAGGLVAATASKLVLSKTGFVIRASSANQSVLALPIQYSHCWSTPATNAQLFRANLMQLGIRFTGTLDTVLVFRFGSLLAGRCRLEDANDMDRLKIAQARAR
jgi:hypothetical protein